MDEPQRAALGAPPLGLVLDLRGELPQVARDDEHLAHWSVSERWPFDRSSHALSASPITPYVSDVWRSHSIAEAIVRYWLMRRNVTGCESCVAPRGVVGSTE